MSGVRKEHPPHPSTSPVFHETSKGLCCRISGRHKDACARGVGSEIVPFALEDPVEDAVLNLLCYESCVSGITPKRVVRTKIHLSRSR